MSFEPLLSAPTPIPLHTFAALAAVVLGGIQFALPKGTATHRLIGRVWVALLAVVAISGFFINEFRTFGPFSPIHILSAFTLVMLWRAVRFARAGRIKAHQKAMTAIYVLALLVTGAFTFLPGRVMHQVVTGG